MKRRSTTFAAAALGAAALLVAAAGCGPDRDDDATPAPTVNTAAPGDPGSVPTVAGTEKAADEAAERVEDLLEADATLKAYDLDAEEEGGRLVLKGEVKTAAEKTAAEEIARVNAPGLTVVSEIRIDD